MNLDKSAAYNNIVVMGLGGVGGYFGGMIALNITTNWRDKRDLTFIARRRRDLCVRLPRDRSQQPGLRRDVGR